jgi:hypothetical protein
MSLTPRSVLDPTRRAFATVTSWDGTRPGIRFRPLRRLCWQVVSSNLFHQISYLRQGDRVFETYWTTGPGVEVMAPTYRLLDNTVYGRQETWEDSPEGWPQRYGQQVRPDVATEPNPFWLEFCRSLARRGLSGVQLVISDAHEGLRSALAQVFTGATWQRCKVHFLRNVASAVPKLHAPAGRTSH